MEILVCSGILVGKLRRKDLDKRKIREGKEKEEERKEKGRFEIGK